MKGTQRTGVAVAGATALALAFGTGLAVGGSDDQTDGRGRLIAGPDQRQPVSDPIVLANADLTSTSSCEELLGWYVDRGLERVTPYGWDSGAIYFDTGGVAESSDAARESAAGAPTLPQVDGATNNDTGTNVQEAGVDEPDVVKTDGEILVRVQDDELTAYDVTGAEPTWLDSIDLPGMAAAEILLIGDTVVAIGTDTETDSVWDRDSGTGRPYDGYYWEDPGTRMLVVDVTDPATLAITDDHAYDATLVSARLHGGVVRLALSAGLPALDFVDPVGLRTDDSALERNRDIVRESTLEDWLPGVTIDDNRDDLLECADVALPDDDAGLGTLAVVGFDASTPETWDASAVATDSQIVYASADRLVLATSAWPGGWCCLAVDGPSRAVDDGTTRLYSFALRGTETTYVASGEVEGALADRWAMDEADGVLRLAVGPTSMTGAFNSVVTLQESDDDLREVGRVDELGVGEEIKSVRWFDDLAIVVTFRQTDPLYAVDLTDPSAPELLGELKIPGFSEYLHPFGGWRMIGVGQDADATTGMTRGAQAALFDVHDLTDPRRLDVTTYSPGSRAHAGLDPRQFTWLPDSRTALTVISEGDVGTTGWVSVLRVEDGRLSNRMVEVEYGAEVDQVRLVPLPTGRVVLVTGDEVSFFDLDG